jgi:23S rRNA (uracil1939-C5)-methyltransferase
MSSTLEATPGTADAADQRIACVHADRCGGCPILGLPYGEQLLVKRGRVLQSLSRYPALEAARTEPLLPATPITGYRTRAKLIVAPGGTVGLYAKGGGHQVVDIPDCRVLSPAIAEAAAVLRAIVALHEQEGGVLAPVGATAGALRALDIRETRGAAGEPPRVLLTLVLTRGRAAPLTELVAFADTLRTTHPLFVGIAVNYHDDDSPQVLGGETRLLSGVDTRPDRVGSSTHLATFGSFVQSHRAQAARVHELVLRGLDVEGGPRARRFLDLYGGSGAIALALAAGGVNTTLVESYGPAVANALAAAAAQSLALEAECEDVGISLRQRAQRGEAFDAAVVNPSRRGMSPLAREGLPRLGVSSIAYVSCDPDTLARDLDHLARLGYSADTLQPLDMIPLTDEVETVTILRRGASTAPVVLYEDSDVLVVAKAPHEPVLPRADHPAGASLRERAARLPGHASTQLRPLTREDAGASGLVFFSKSEEAHELFSAAFASTTARRVYVVYARGVTPQKGTIARDLRENGQVRSARTRYRRLAIAGGHSVLRVVPELERPHQVRRHLAAIGHPVLGDERYGHAASNRFFEQRNGLDRTFIHGVRVELDHPRTGRRFVVDSPLHGDLRAVLERTSGPGTLRFLEQKQALGSDASLSSFPAALDAEAAPESALDIELGAPSMRAVIATDDD